MTPVAMLHDDGGGLVELLVDPRAWVVDGAPSEPGIALRAATWLRRPLSAAELAECTCPVDCLRDHPDE